MFLKRVLHTSRCGVLVEPSRIVQVSNLLIVLDIERESSNGQALLNVGPSSMPDFPSPYPHALVGVNNVRHPPIKSQVD